MSAVLTFEWDDVKNAANIVKHGISFERAVIVFGHRHRMEIDATHAIDAEVRHKIVAPIEGRLFTVVFTLRGTAIRVISARRSNKREERAYGNRPL